MTKTNEISVTDTRVASYLDLGLQFISYLVKTTLKKPMPKLFFFPLGLGENTDIRCYILLKFRNHTVQKTRAFLFLFLAKYMWQNLNKLKSSKGSLPYNQKELISTIYKAFWKKKKSNIINRELKDSNGQQTYTRLSFTSNQ